MDVCVSSCLFKYIDKCLKNQPNVSDRVWVLDETETKLRVHIFNVRFKSKLFDKRTFPYFVFCHLIHQVIKFHQGVHEFLPRFTISLLFPFSFPLYNMYDRSPNRGITSMSKITAWFIAGFFRPYYLLIAFQWFVSIEWCLLV